MRAADVEVGGVEQHVAGRVEAVLESLAQDVVDQLHPRGVDGHESLWVPEPVDLSVGVDERHGREPQPGAVAGRHLDDPPVGRCAGLGDEPHPRTRPEQHREHLEQRPGIVVARQHHRRGDRAELVSAPSARRRSAVAGRSPSKTSPEWMIRSGSAARAWSTISARHGFVIGRAADAPQRLSDVPVGGVKQTGHLRAPRARWLPLRAARGSALRPRSSSRTAGMGTATGSGPGSAAGSRPSCRAETGWRARAARE